MNDELGKPFCIHHSSFIIPNSSFLQLSPQPRFREPPAAFERRVRDAERDARFFNRQAAKNRSSTMRLFCSSTAANFSSAASSSIKSTSDSLTNLSAVVMDNRHWLPPPRFSRLRARNQPESAASRLPPCRRNAPDFRSSSRGCQSISDTLR